MKKLATLLVLLLSSINANAALLGAPFLPEIDNRFNCIETGYCNTAYPGAQVFATVVGSSTYPVGLGGMQNPGAGRSTVAFMDYVVKESINLAGEVAGVNYPLGASIPGNAIITQAFVVIKGPPAPGGTKIAVSCMTQGDIFAATDESAVSANTIVAGVETGTPATMLYVNSFGCTPWITPTVHSATAGTVEVYITYILSQ